jgi:hypothetical protein
LQLLIDVKGQAGLRRLHGTVAWEGNLSEMRTGRVRTAP